MLVSIFYYLIHQTRNKLTGLCQYFRKVPDLALFLYMADLNILIFEIFAFDNIHFNYDFFSKCHNNISAERFESAGKLLTFNIPRRANCFAGNIKCQKFSLQKHLCICRGYEFFGFNRI